MHLNFSSIVFSCLILNSKKCFRFFELIKFSELCNKSFILFVYLKSKNYANVFENISIPDAKKLKLNCTVDRT